MGNYKKRKKNTARNQRIRRNNRKRQQMKRVLTAVLVLFAVGVVCLILALATSLMGVFSGTNETPATTATTLVTGGETTVPPISNTTTANTTATAATTAKTTQATVADSGNHYVQPAGAAWNLKLANDWNTLPESYDNTLTLVELVPGNTKSQFDSRAVESLRAMLAAGNAADPSMNLQPVSCYRSVARQKTLYWNEVAKWKNKGYGQAEAEAKAATVVKRPGQSEHSTGLAADLGGNGNYDLNENFENTAAFKWLYANCAEYGFILRFPKGKENITGVIYEPWHFRYVGKEVAKQIMSEGICLEEYLQKTAQ